MRWLFALVLALWSGGQVPQVADYDELVSAVDASRPAGLFLESDYNRYGQPVKTYMYHEVRPGPGGKLFFYHERFQEPTGNFDVKPSGNAYVCLCAKDDLRALLERWRDEQYGMDDFGPFACKYRPLTRPHDWKAGESFWQQVFRRAAGEKKLPTLILRDVSVKRYSNTSNPDREIIRIEVPVPAGRLFKPIVDKSFVRSVQDETGRELLFDTTGTDWMAMFPDWFRYEKLNAGFWGTPRRVNPVQDGRYHTRVAIAPATGPLHIRGQVAFWKFTGLQQTRELDGLPVLTKNRYTLNKEVYLDYGEWLTYGVTGADPERGRISVRFNSDAPLTAVEVFDAATGERLGRAEKPAFELDLPASCRQVRLRVQYEQLAPVVYLYDFVGE